jgi:hypothetical protein
MLMGVIIFRFPEYLEIPKTVGVEGERSLGYCKEDPQLWMGTGGKERRYGVFKKLSHEALTKTNYRIIYPRGRKTRHLKLVTS